MSTLGLGLFILTCCLTLSTVVAFHFNDPCDLTSDCDQTRFLECVNKKCLCKTNEADYISNICRLLANVPCQKLDIGVQPCAMNSECTGTPSTCECKNLFVPNKDNRCFLPYGEACNTTANPSECDPLGFFSCNKNKGQCSCDEQQTIYDDVINACRLLVQSPCNSTGTPKQECVKNAGCIPVGSGEARRCSNPFVQNSARECRLPYGENCDRGNDLCSEERYLTCGLANRCICLNDLNTLYNPVTGSCVIKANKECSPGDQPCVANAMCESASTGESSTCVCQGNFESNSLGQCVLSYGRTCDPNLDECDPTTFTQCSASTKTCRCQNENTATMYDPIKRTCKLLADTACGQTSQQCVDRAICSTTENKCKCNPGFEPSINRQCIVPYGKSCASNGNDHCDRVNFQECGETNTCACQRSKDSIFDPTTQRCFLKHSASCTIPEGPTVQKCAVNSICDPVTEKCVCEGRALQPNDRGLCVLDNGQACNPLDDKCDIYGYLECGPNSVCGCQRPNDTWFDNETKMCALLHGVSCTTSSNAQKCTARSTCGGVPSKCSCDRNMLPTKNRRCYSPFNSTCDLGMDYCDFEDGFMRCAAATKRCDCMRTDMAYDASSKECYVLPEGRCSLINGSPVCGGNSECSTEGRCTCKSKEGYENTGQGICLKGYLSTCNAITECNYYNNLKCVEGTCICPQNAFIPENDTTTGRVRCYAGYQHPCTPTQSCSKKANLWCSAIGICQCLSPAEQEFFPEVLKCLSLAGSRCNLNSPPGEYSLECIENATCQEDDSAGSGVYGTCVCDAKFKETDRKMCSGVYRGFVVSMSMEILSFLILCLGNNVLGSWNEQ